MSNLYRRTPQRTKHGVRDLSGQQNVWVERDSDIVHFRDDIQPHVFSLCGKGFSSGMYRPLLAAPVRTVTCLACLAMK